VYHCILLQESEILCKLFTADEYINEHIMFSSDLCLGLKRVISVLRHKTIQVMKACMKSRFHFNTVNTCVVLCACLHQPVTLWQYALQHIFFKLAQHAVCLQDYVEIFSAHLATFLVVFERVISCETLPFA
jgi:hypothetical protein